MEKIESTRMSSAQLSKSSGCHRCPPPGKKSKIFLGIFDREIRLYQIAPFKEVVLRWIWSAGQ